MNTKQIVDIVLEELPDDCTLQQLLEQLSLVSQLQEQSARALSPEEVVDPVRAFREGPFEEAGAEGALYGTTTMGGREGTGTIFAYQGFDWSPTTSSATNAKVGGLLVLAASIASFVVGLTEFPGSHLGAALTFGGAVLAYEAFGVLLQDRN